MSGQMNNVEIEDVLSSIRRLVSEETRIAPPKGLERGDDLAVKGPFADGSATSQALADLRAMPSRPVETPNSPDKLLLSPAFRVPDVGSANSPEAGLVPRADLASLEATIAELEAAVGSTPGVFESDGGTDPYPQSGVLGGETTPLAGDDASLESEAERMARVPAFVSRNSPRAIQATNADSTIDIPTLKRGAESRSEDRAFDESRFDSVAFDHAAAQLRNKSDLPANEDVERALSEDELTELEADRAFSATADAIATHQGEFTDDAPEAAVDDPDLSAQADLDEAGFEIAEDVPAHPNTVAEVLSFADHAAALRAEVADAISAEETPEESQNTVFDAVSDEFTVTEADFADHADVEMRDVHFEDASAEDDALYVTVSDAATTDDDNVVPFAPNGDIPPLADAQIAEPVHSDDDSAFVANDDMAETPSSRGNGFSHGHDAFTWRMPDPAIVGAVGTAGVLATIATVSEKPAAALNKDKVVPQTADDLAAPVLPADAPQRDVAAKVEASEDLAGSDDFSVFDVEETVIDEAALRDLIATIIREELQGALGERITRNVRKLVRAEIQQALAARDGD